MESLKTFIPSRTASFSKVCPRRRAGATGDQKGFQNWPTKSLIPKRESPCARRKSSGICPRSFWRSCCCVPPNGSFDADGGSCEEVAIELVRRGTPPRGLSGARGHLLRDRRGSGRRT